jgi:hypothetical protein
VHGANVDIGFASYITDGANKSRPIEMVAKEKVSASGYDIHPEIIDLDDVSLAVSNCARYSSGSNIGIDLQCK